MKVILIDLGQMVKRMERAGIVTDARKPLVPAVSGAQDVTLPHSIHAGEPINEAER